MKAIGREGSRGLGVESTRKEREERIRSNLELYQGCIDVRRATPRRMGVNMEFIIVYSFCFLFQDQRRRKWRLLWKLSGFLESPRFSVAIEYGPEGRSELWLCCELKRVMVASRGRR